MARVVFDKGIAIKGAIQLDHLISEVSRSVAVADDCPVLFASG
jgi:hypothetical protein